MGKRTIIDTNGEAVELPPEWNSWGEMLESRHRMSIESLKTEARWREIVADELACTMELIDAAGVRGRVEAGEAVQAVLLDSIRTWRAKAEGASA